MGFRFVKRAAVFRQWLGWSRSGIEKDEFHFSGGFSFIVSVSSASVLP